METKSPNSYSWFMKREAFILTLAIIFIFVFGIALTVGYSHYKGQIKNTIQRNKLTANLLAALILEHQKAAIGIIQSYASRPLLINAAKKKDFNEIIKHLTHLKENNHEIDNTFVTDQDAILWADFPLDIDKKSYGKNFSHRDWFKGVSKEWKTYVSSVYQMIVGEKDLAVAVCAPIFDEKGKAIGILGTAQRTDFLGRIIRQVKLDAENKITLIDQVGNIIYSDRFAYEKRVIGYPFVDLINKAITEKKDDLEIQDPHESSNVRYTAFVPIKEFGWSVIVEREKRSVLRSEFEYFFQLAFLSTLLFLFIAISLAFFRKQFIYRQTVVLLNTEKELREKERRYSSLLENINLVAVGLDTDGNITFANPFLLKLTGYALEEILAKNWFDIFIPGKDKEDVKRVFKEVLSNELFPHYDNPILTKSGDERLIAWNNTTLKDIHGQVLGMMSIGEDITERKRAEEELR